MILAIVISLAILAGAFVLKYLATEVIEEMNTFLIISGCFLLVYVTAAIFLSFLVPNVKGEARIASFFSTAVAAGPRNGF